MNIEYSPSPNRFNGRMGKSIIAIVNHITAGNFPGCLTWMKNPAAKASAHYLITRTGKIYQMVKDENAAWHAGFINKPSWKLNDGTNPNYITLGIEHEALTGNHGLTEAQYQSTLELHKILIAKYKIPVDKDHIIGHCHIDSVNRPNDPGSAFPWDRLFKDLKNESYKIIPIAVTNKTVNGLLINSMTYAPVRAIGEALGEIVNWDSVYRCAIIGKPSIPLKKAAEGAVNIIAKNKIMAGKLIDDTTYAPVRELAELLGRRVDWDSKTESVRIV